ncbi:hypothetical protein [Methanonatronarchaeum thermophilum]|nr:hypothetical protein [Methanonatronarchaeum thermophilum]
MAKPYKVIEVNPKKIEFLKVPHFYRTISEYGTFIRDGNWDKKISEDEIGYFRLREKEKIGYFENYTFYKCVKNWLGGEKWEETSCYEILAKKKDKEHAKKKEFKLKKILGSIEKNGYKSQNQFKQKNTSILKKILRIPPQHNEIALNIDRHGNFIFDDGKHRLCIVKVLKIEKIPARILVRHKKWQEIRKEVYEADYIEELSKKAKINLNHPDLHDILKNKNFVSEDKNS